MMVVLGMLLFAAAAQEPSEAASKLDMALDDIGGEISREPAICRYFTSAGGCIYGDNCWFSHVLPAPAPPAAPEAAREDSAEVPAADAEDGSNADADSDAVSYLFISRAVRKACLLCVY